MLIILMIINIMLSAYIIYSNSNISISFNSLIPWYKAKDNDVEVFIEELNPAEERITAFRERMKGVAKDRDGLYDVSPPLVQTEFTGTEIITPSMEIQSDRRY